MKLSLDWLWIILYGWRGLRWMALMCMRKLMITTGSGQKLASPPGWRLLPAWSSSSPPPPPPTSFHQRPEEKTKPGRFLPEGYFCYLNAVWSRETLKRTSFKTIYFLLFSRQIDPVFTNRLGLIRVTEWKESGGGGWQIWNWETWQTFFHAIFILRLSKILLKDYNVRRRANPYPSGLLMWRRNTLSV